MSPAPSRARVLAAPISWWQVIVDLERQGYTHASIAAAIGSARGTVEGWKNKNAQPRHEDGECLILLWCAAVGRERAEVPVRSETARAIADTR